MTTCRIHAAPPTTRNTNPAPNTTARGGPGPAHNDTDTETPQPARLPPGNAEDTQRVDIHPSRGHTPPVTDHAGHGERTIAALGADRAPGATARAKAGPVHDDTPEPTRLRCAGGVECGGVGAVRDRTLAVCGWGGRTAGASGGDGGAGRGGRGRGRGPGCGAWSGGWVGG